MIDQVVAYIVAIAPSLITIISVICMVVKIIKQFTSLREEVKNSKEMEEIKNQIQIVVQENYELKKQIKLMVQKLDKVKIKDNKEVK